MTLIAGRPTGTVRISDSSHRTLRELSDSEHLSMQAVLERAIEDYRRRHFLDALNDSYASLRAREIADERAERDEWNVTTSDGLAND
jgi:hypothetical protein